MGIIHPSISFELAENLKTTFRLRSFVETGTYLGNTSAWAASHFERVITIEADAALYARARERFANQSNVEVYFGNSGEIISVIVSRLPDPSLFWLDAHYSGEGTAGESHECPLLAEIAALDASPIEHVVLIDDARMFLSPPPPPHRVEEWPNIRMVIERLCARKPDSFICVFEDVIIRVPAEAKVRLLPLIRSKWDRAV